MALHWPFCLEAGGACVPCRADFNGILPPSRSCCARSHSPYSISTVMVRFLVGGARYFWVAMVYSDTFRCPV